MHDLRMRTTIEIDDEKLIKLKKLAAERGERGFSKLVDAALAAFHYHALRDSSRNSLRPWTATL